jgi:DNA polymerase-3 subunit beta
MMAALDRVLIFNTDNNRCTYFDLEAGEVSLSSQGQEVGSASESLEGTYDGSLKRIAFPTRNLIEIMNHYQSDSMRFTLTGTEGPCGLTGENDPDYLVIVMPMKIVEETYYSEEEV